MSPLQQQITTVVIQVIFYSGLAVPAVLALFWPWWRSELGWSIVAKTICLSLALLGAMLTYWFGPVGFTRSAFLQWFTIAALAAVPVVLWWRVWVIFKTQRSGSRRHYLGRAPRETTRAPRA